jgi:short-subunit dehydrogenase
VDTSLLISLGHHVVLHDRNPAKLQEVAKELLEVADSVGVESYVADISRRADVEALAKEVAEKHAKLDVLINNAGIDSAPDLIVCGEQN